MLKQWAEVLFIIHFGPLPVPFHVPSYTHQTLLRHIKAYINQQLFP